MKSSWVVQQQQQQEGNKETAEAAAAAAAAAILIFQLFCHWIQQLGFSAFQRSNIC